METAELLPGEKICPNCGDTFKGRIDKIFCGPECRTDYNNRNKREQKKNAPAAPPTAPADIPEFMEVRMKLVPELQDIIDILLKNWGILSALCTEDRPGHLPMRDLLGKGFNPTFITSVDKPNSNGHIYRFCFDHGYREDPDGTAVIICRPREIEIY
jgi:hypothetical protein